MAFQRSGHASEWVMRVDWMKGNPIVRGDERPREIIGQTIERDLD